MPDFMAVKSGITQSKPGLQARIAVYQTHGGPPDTVVAYSPLRASVTKIGNVQPITGIRYDLGNTVTVTAYSPSWASVTKIGNVEIGPLISCSWNQ